MFYSLKVVNIKVEYIGKLLLCNFRFEREKNVLILLNLFLHIFLFVRFPYI